MRHRVVSVSSLSSSKGYSPIIRRLDARFPFATTTSNPEAATPVKPVSLAKRLKDAYEHRGTDGVLELASKISKKIPAHEILHHIEQASRGCKGTAASMLNAWIGSHYQRQLEQTNREDSAGKAQDLFETWESVAAQDSSFCQLDTVSFALSFAAVSLDEDYDDQAQTILEKALKFSKKQGGSKRRKALAAARRRAADTATNRLADIQTTLGDTDKDFRVLAETDDYVVVSKPSGVACSHKMITTAGKTNRSRQRQKNDKLIDVSLVDALVSCNVPLSTLSPESQGLVHRLDRGTSGCLFLAKTDVSHALAIAEFFTRRSTKTYLTILAPAPSEDEGTIDIPVDGRPARSLFRVKEKFGSSAAALVEFTILSGRKHQIRAHSAQGLGSSVLCDKLYGNDKMDALLKDLPHNEDGRERFFLHAQSLELPAMDVKVETPIPQWWEPTMDVLRRQSH